MATKVGPDGRTHYVYTISGVRVEFPAKAYPTQIAMMDKVIRGLQRSQHCLLESPTGSGKTLALLCASLAWQRAEADKVRSHNYEVEDAHRANLKIAAQTAAAAAAAARKVKVELLKCERLPEPELEQSVDQVDTDMSAYYSDDNSDDDFKLPTKKRTKVSPSVKMPPPPATPVKPAIEKLEELTVSPAVEMTPTADLKKLKIPVIYFGTRTHKQIAQVIKEFKRTVYSSTPMDILASREHTCIHPEVSRSSAKNEGCRELTDKRQMRKGGGCSYFKGAKEKFKSHSIMIHHGHETGWDIEDLVKLGRRLRSCPYYATRGLMETAQIVFCPYNYLIDPRIRSSMEIPIKGNIIILDEAHNIEDSAREAAGGTFSQEDFRLAMTDCEKVSGQNKNLGRDIQQLSELSSHLMNWIDEQAKSMKNVSIDCQVNVMNGTEFVASLSNGGYGPEKLIQLRATFDYIVAEQKEVESGKSEWTDEAEKQEPQLSTATLSLIEGFLIIMELMLADNQINRDDYRAVVVRTIERKKKASSAAGWLQKNVSSQWTYCLKLWCMNPAVVLKFVREATRSIVVTSGTLSPLASYQTELDIDFKISLEANHVIPLNRVWVGSISHGPRGTLLNGTFKSTSTFEYQDELGRLILSVCETVPHGVLCFLPSYSLLEKLATRWRSTGLWDHMSQIKSIVCESRESSAFEETLKTFYDAIRESEKLAQEGDLNDSAAAETGEGIERGGPCGALMLAVCRGKVSEGLDFTDNNARAVVCIGIPFPNFKDTQVELKREYNDKKSAATRVLNGSEWYEIQAFRALNQALGRCIRHKADWGAILLVDDRFSKIPRYVNGLSKWVRSSLCHYNNFNPMIFKLKEFTENFVAEDAEIYSQQSQMSQMSQMSQSAEKPICSSPYFQPVPKALPSVESDEITILTPAKKVIPCFNLSDSPVEAVAGDTTVMKDTRQEANPKDISMVDKTDQLKRNLATLMGHSSQMSRAQRNLAAENGSPYFQIDE